MLFKTCKTPLTAFDVFLSLRSGLHPFILDSGLDPGRLGRYSFVGVDPFLTFSSKGETVRINRHGKEEVRHGADPFGGLRELLNRYRVPYSPENPHFVGGAVGYFGYDLCHFIETLPRTAIDDVRIPDCFFAFYDGVYMFDHQAGTACIVAPGMEGDPGQTLSRMESHLERAASDPPRMIPYRASPSVTFRPNLSKYVYRAAIERIKAYIRAGDIYQVNFTQRFECPFHGDPVSFYDRLRSINPAPFSAYLDTGECAVLSSSPERFIRVRNGIVETRPIKGTCARGHTEEEDEKMRCSLMASEKDRSELLMIVDLERNDLGRIAKAGTVRVPELFALETYPTVHHLVATVTAELRPELDLIDCIRATFPGGSITGAPKIRSMEIIDELEPTQRNVYTGSMGYLGFDGSMDMNIVIRTVLIKDHKAYLQAGGGITWDSDTEKEYEESLIKAKALMEALSSQEDSRENLERRTMAGTERNR